jgi:hypothetical protein
LSVVVSWAWAIAVATGRLACRGWRSLARRGWPAPRWLAQRRPYLEPGTWGGYEIDGRSVRVEYEGHDRNADRAARACERKVTLPVQEWWARVICSSA